MAFGAAANGGALDIAFDGEVPRSFTGIARQAISGGQFVTVSGAANVVGSDMSSFVTGSIVVDLIANSNSAVGIALHNAGSNQLVSVATRGFYIANAAGIVSGGYAVYPVNGTVQGVAMQPITAYSGGQIRVGTAITAAASGTTSYCLVNFAF